MSLQSTCELATSEQQGRTCELATSEQQGRAGDARWKHDGDEEREVQGEHSGACSETKGAGNNHEKHGQKALEVQRSKRCAPASVELHAAASKEIPPLRGVSDRAAAGGVRGAHLVMQRVGAALRVELAGADPAPVAAASRTVHVIAAIGFVRDNATLRAFLAVLLDLRCRGLLNSGVAAHPVRTRLPRVRVAVGKAVPATGN